MRIWRLLLVVAMAVLSLTGCGATSYSVIDVFKYANYDQLPKEVRPPSQFFLVIKDPATPRGERKVYVDREFWESCWMGDSYQDHQIGKDECVRTSESEMPTRLKKKG